MFLLDTNVISELRRLGTGQADANVAAWAATAEPSSFHISVITLQELEVGVRLMERRDAKQGAAYRLWLDGRVLPSLRGRIIPISEPVALRCATLHVPDRRPALDSLIAATALVHGLTMVTRNVADFQHDGLAILNPWHPR